MLAADPAADVWTIASRLTWTTGWDAMVGPLMWSALAQTELHVRHLTGVAQAN